MQLPDTSPSVDPSEDARLLVALVFFVWVPFLLCGVTLAGAAVRWLLGRAARAARP